MDGPPARVAYHSVKSGVCGCVTAKTRDQCLSWVIRDACSLRLDRRYVASYPKADMAPMPRDGAIVFGDLVGKLTVLRVEYSKCGRFGRYPLHRLIDKHGGNGTIIAWLDALTADCPAVQFAYFYLRRIRHFCNFRLPHQEI